jgi:oligopeptide/dipeptide ABC transporter ATP-binding protein
VSEAPSATAQPTVEVSDLQVRFHLEQGIVRAVDGVSFRLFEGRTLGVVGESGSGKSVTSLALMRLLDPGLCEVSGSVQLEGRELLALPEREMRAVRGRDMAMIFQDPMTSLNPFLRVGVQLTEALHIHERVSRREARQRAIHMLARVGIADAAQRFTLYPHQLSGGMRQRVMIAMALLCRPRVLIADEPTTALDVTIQAQILELLRELSRELGTAVLFITHDLGVVASLCDDVAIMYAGRIVETGSVEAVLGRPAHPYTRALLASVPLLDDVRPLSPVPGAPPAGFRVPRGCAFAPRCSLAQDSCTRGGPSLLEVTPGHTARCPLTAAANA